jgi:hypothetical protein
MIDSSIAEKTPLPTPFASDLSALIDDLDYYETISNDEEAVGLFYKVITVIRTRDSMLMHKETPKPANFDTYGFPTSIREHVRELVRLNSIIVLEHFSAAQQRGSGSDSEDVTAAMKTIQLIEASQHDGLAMCLWYEILQSLSTSYLLWMSIAYSDMGRMWLYYAFTAVAVLFSHTVRCPEGSDAVFHLALISDIHSICAEYSGVSAAARRIQKLTGEMERVGFEMVKRVSKKRAREGGDGDRSVEKRGRIEEPTITDESGSSAAKETQQTSTEGIAPVEDFVLLEGLQEPPTNFVWEDWEVWFQQTAVDFDG